MVILGSYLKGDDFAISKVKGFFSGFLEEFYGVQGKEIDTENSNLLSLGNLKRIGVLHSPRFDTLEDLDRLMSRIVEYVRESIRQVDLGESVEHYFGTEWSKFDHEYSYQIAQFNAIKTRSTLKDLYTIFAREVMYEIYCEGARLRMRQRKQSMSMTCKSGIDSWGLYEPHINYRGSRDNPAYLSTRQPDLRILREYFEKYGLIEFLPDPEDDRYHISRYGGWDCPRMLNNLNQLKYLHLNLGETPRRRVLQLKGAPVLHVGSLTDKDVIGRKFY